MDETVLRLGQAQVRDSEVEGRLDVVPVGQCIRLANALDGVLIAAEPQVVPAHDQGQSSPNARG